MTIQVQVPLVRLSLCSCGYGFLDASIQIGVKYTVDLSSARSLWYRCGNCGKGQRVTGILASQQLHPERPMAYLPAGLFDLPTGDAIGRT